MDQDPSERKSSGKLPLGFISIDATLHRPPGDPYNARTWPFPLIREKAHNTPVSAVVSANAYSDDFLDRFVQAGKRLAERGAVGIITSCGFLAIAQPDLAARLPIPIVTSSLIQIPSLLAVAPRTSKIGILTFDEKLLGEAHLRKLEINSSRCCIRGAPANGFLQRHIRHGEEYSHDGISQELVAVAKDMIATDPEIAFVCLECTNMPPFSDAIQTATGLPVYDIYTAGSWFYSGLVNTRRQCWDHQDSEFDQR